MNSPFLKTGLIGLIAAGVSAVAAFYYPWPETVVENDMVDKPLFEEYDSSSVRAIEITKYDADKNGYDRIKLKRQGEKWVIPSENNFVANDVKQISDTINSLNNLVVLENRSNRQEDHIQYNVVDPADYETTVNRGSLGTKIILQNRTNAELASLIVGSRSGREASKYFMRIPGQPNVYVADFNPQALATNFTSWVDSNLLQISQLVNPTSIEIKNYRIDSAQLEAGEKQWTYQAMLDLKNRNVKLSAPQATTAELSEAKVTQANVQKLNSLGPFLGNIRFTDVRRKSDAAAAVLSKRTREDDTSGALDSLVPNGFKKTGFDQRFKFDATEGEIVWKTEDGVVISLLIGGLVENANSDELVLSHNLMLYASVNRSVFPIPEEPAVSDDAEQADKDKRAYLRKVEQRTEKIKAANLRASELNQSYGDWYYVVSEEIIAGLMPDLKIEGFISKAESEAEPNSKKAVDQPEGQGSEQPTQNESETEAANEAAKKENAIDSEDGNSENDADPKKENETEETAGSGSNSDEPSDSEDADK